MQPSQINRDDLHFDTLEELSRRSLFHFLTYLFPIQTVTWSWHHESVCNNLQKLYEGEYNRLMIFMPPQHQKSTMMTEYFPAWCFGQNPDSQIMLVMYDSPMAEKYNRKIQRIITCDKYKRIFSDTKLNEKNVVSDSQGNYVRNSREFEIVNKSGFLKSVGIGAGIAGNPAKIALIDDIIKNVAEAQSITYRNKTYEWYSDELNARLHNDSKVAFTITRRHEDDLAGRLLDRDGTIEEGGKWKVVKYPAIKEDNENPDDIRALGEALFPELHDLERLEDIRDKDNRTFISLYQQRPAPEEGNMVKKDWFEIISLDQVPGYGSDMYIDGAYTKDTKNDPTGLMTCYNENNILYVTNYIDKYLEMPELLEFVPQFAYANDVTAENLIRIEPKASGKSLKQLLIKETGYNATEIDGKHVGEGKTARLNACSPTMQAGRVKLVKGHWNDNFINQLTSFPNGKHDEAVDCLCYAIFDYFLNKKDYDNVISW